MNVHNKPGSKERLFEMFGTVAKVQINEGVMTPEIKQTLEIALEKLKLGALKAEQGGSVEAKMLDNYVGINGYDRDRNMYNFNFKITGEEGEQDGVEMINDVYLERFYYQNPRGIKVVELEENELQEFNKEHGAEMYDAIEEYIDITPKETSAGSEEEIDVQEPEVEESIDKKPESDPYGGARQEYQDGKGYGDEKPVNPKLRVKAPELDKFVREYEEEEEDFGIEGLPDVPSGRGAGRYAKQDMKQEFGKELSPDDSFLSKNDDTEVGQKIDQAHDWRPELGRHNDLEDPKLAEREMPNTNYDELAGEKLIQAKHSSLAADMEYQKLAKAYENFLKVKKIEFKPSDVLQKALSAARDLIAEYLQTVKGLDVTPEDVQNYFQNTIAKYSSVVSEAEEELAEPEVKQPEGWKDVEGFFQDDGGVMKWTDKPESDDATTLEIPTGEPEAEMGVEIDGVEPSLDPDDADGDGDMIPGGVADDADIGTYDADQVLKGMEVEMEHTDDPKVALEIAMDHLEEFGDYYTRLDGMEKEAEADLEGGGEEPLMGGPQASDEPLSMSPPEDAPEELAGHFDEIGNADKELEDAMLGFKSNTPNANRDE